MATEYEPSLVSDYGFSLMIEKGREKGVPYFYPCGKEVTLDMIRYKSTSWLQFSCLFNSFLCTNFVIQDFMMNVIKINAVIETGYLMWFIEVLTPLG